MDTDSPKQLQILPEETASCYPSQSSCRLKKYVENKYGGKITCAKAARIMNDPDISHFYKKAARWYKNLHCKGSKQIREEESGIDKGSALTIFDIDDTLMKSDSIHRVIRPNQPPLELSDEERKNYKLKPGEKFDDSDFESAQKFNTTAKPIKNIWKTAQGVLNKIAKRPSSRMVIITARKSSDDEEMFIDTFEKHGLDMSKVYVFYAGNLKRGTSESSKQSVIRNLLNAGPYTEVRLFDDKFENLKAFLHLKKEFPDIVFTAYPVSKYGKIGKPAVV